MKNKCKLLPLILLCILLLSACGGGKAPSSDIQLGGKDSSSDIQLGGKDSSSDIQLGEPFEFTSGLAEGALQVTVKSARRITDVSELPPQEMFLEYYDNYVLSDGTLKEGSSFIILDLEVKSLDAAAKTSKYGDEDPYEFGADGLLTLIDLTEKQGKNYTFSPVDYFSLYGQGQDPDHPFAFKLSPGETIEFEVGCFVGKKRDGSERDLSQLRASTGISTRSDLIDLKLGEDRDA